MTINKLFLEKDGLIVGTTQLVTSGGNVDVGKNLSVHGATYVDNQIVVGNGTPNLGFKLEATSNTSGNAFLINAPGGQNPNFIMSGAGEQTFRFHNTATTGSTRVSWKMASRNNVDWTWIMYTDIAEQGVEDWTLHHYKSGRVMYVSDSGNVRFGYGSPASPTQPVYKIDTDIGSVNNNVNSFGYNIFADATSAIGYSGYNLQLNNSTANASGYLRLARTSGTAYLGLELASQSRDGIRFLTHASNPVETLRLDASGNLIVGNGDLSTTPTSPLIRGTNASGTNINGGNISIQGGLSTGTGTGGKVAFLTGTTLASGATLQTATERMSIAPSGANTTLDLVTSMTTANVFNTTATTVNFANAATSVSEYGAATSLAIGNTATAAQTVNLFTASTGASTYNIATGATLAATTKSINIGTNGVSTSVTNITLGSAVSGSTGTVTINGTAISIATNSATAVTTIVGPAVTGNILKLSSTTGGTINLTTDVTTGIVNLYTGLTTGTLNVATGGASTTNIGGAGGILNIGTTSADSALEIRGNASSGTATIRTNTGVVTANVFNTIATTGNMFGAATTIGIGATSGTITINNPTLVGSQTTQNVYNTVATTVNAFGAASALNMGAATGTLTIGNPTITGTNAATFNMNGANPSIVTTSTGTVSVFNINAATGNLFGAATSANIAASAASASTLTFGPAITNNTFKIGSTAAGTINLTSDVTTGTINLYNGLTTGNINVGSATSTFTVQGNLVVNGTTVTVNSSTITVDDKNIELGAVASVVVSTSGTVGSITGSGPWTATITNMSDTADLIVGSAITATAGTGTLGTSGTAIVASIVSSTSVTYTYTGGTAPTAGTVTGITTTGATDLTADGGGIILNGATNKTFLFSNSNTRWETNISLGVSGLLTVGTGSAAGTLTSQSAQNLVLNTNNGTNSGNITINQGANANITITPNGTGDVQLVTDTVQIGDLNTTTYLTTNGTGSMVLNTNAGTNSGAITINQGANASIDIEPNGTGDVNLKADTVVVGDAAVAATITTNGAGNLTLNTNSGTNSGSIVINQGTNGNIVLTPDTTGDIYLTSDTIVAGDANADVTVTTNGTGDLILNTNSGTNSGTIRIYDAANGNITIVPNGSGNVGVNTTSPSTKLQVGAKVTDDNTYSYDTNALYVVHQTATSTATLNDPKEVLLLARQGTSAQAYGAAASFRLSRYENSSTSSRTRLDLILAHDSFLTSPTTVLTAQSNGNVGFGIATPRERVDIFGKLLVEGGAATWDTTTPGLTRGSLHIDPGSTTVDQGGAITFGAVDSGNGETAQAGIYVKTSSGYGSKMYFATTDQYSSGSKVRLSIDHVGAVNINNGLTVGTNLVVSGNLTVNGSTTTINSTITTLDDPIITLGGDTAPAADDNKDRGVEFRWHNGTAAKVGFFGFDDSTGYLTFIPDATNTSEVFSGTLGDIQATNFRGNLIGYKYVDNTNETTIAYGHTGGVLYVNYRGATAAVTQINMCNGMAAGTLTNVLASTFLGNLSTSGAANLTINTNSGTNTGSIVINTGVNANIDVAPNGTGKVNLVTNTTQLGVANTATTLTTNGTGNLTISTNNGTNSSSMLINQGVNGSIDFALNGTGTVNIGATTANSTLNVRGNSTTGTATINTNVTTGTVNLMTAVTTGAVNIGSAAAGTVAIAFNKPSTSPTTGALTVTGGVGISGDMYISGNMYSANTVPVVLNDISPQFDGTKTVFDLKVDQTSINTIVDSKDLEVVINGMRLAPYVQELRWPWITPYDSYKGFRVKSGSVVIYDAPYIGDSAVLIARPQSLTTQKRRYPYSASAIALGD